SGTGVSAIIGKSNPKEPAGASRTSRLTPAVRPQNLLRSVLNKIGQRRNPYSREIVTIRCLRLGLWQSSGW
ncbi:MAG: hypothetical protein ACRELF_18785, partial [Gemmataceae bacterium]